MLPHWYVYYTILNPPPPGRIDRANNKRPTKVHAAADEPQRSTRRTSSILHDIMKMLPVEEHGSNPTTPPGSEREGEHYVNLNQQKLFTALKLESNIITYYATNTHAGEITFISPLSALPPIKPKLSIVQYQDAMNLPKMGPAARKAAIERNPSVK